MAVVNEDRYELSMAKGLYNAGSAGSNDTPDGFAQLLQNFIADGARLRPRPNFSTYSNYRNAIGNTTATANLELIDSYNVYEKNRRVWAVGGGVNLPTLIWQCSRGGTTSLGTLLSDDVGNAPLSAHGNSNWVIYSAGGFTFQGFNQYATNIYGATLTSGVKKFSAWNPAAPGNGSGTVTINNVAGAPNTKGLTFFKDRFFGWNNDTIYFTELATTSPGGLPEVWNTGTNFLRVPTNLPGCVVHDVMVYQDRLVVFTNAGLFSLRPLGLPADWSWATIDENIKVQAQVQCVQTRGVIYYVDDTGVWGYNGDNFNLISAAMMNWFDNRFDIQFTDAPRYNLYAVHDGLILVIKQPAAVFTGGGTPWRWDIGECNMFYYNFKYGTWCEWTTPSAINCVDVMGTACDHRSAVHGGLPTSWILMRLDGSMTSNTQFYEVDFNGFSGELYDRTNTFPVPGTNSDQIVSLAWSGKFNSGTPHRIKQMKDAYLESYYFGSSDPFNASVDWYVDDSAVISTTVNLKPIPSVGDKTKFTRFDAQFKYRECQFRINVTTNDYFEIKNVQILQQLEKDDPRRQPNETI